MTDTGRGNFREYRSVCWCPAESDSLGGGIHSEFVSPQFVGAARRKLKLALRVKDGPAPKAHYYGVDLFDTLVCRRNDVDFTVVP